MENLKNGTKIDYEGKKIFYRRNELHIIYEDGEESNLLKDYNLTILRDKFEILSEEDEEIDIQAIEEIHFILGDDENDFDIANKLNEVIKALKQLDKRKIEKKILFDSKGITIGGADAILLNNKKKKQIR